MSDIKFPCNVGDTVYLVEDFNQCYDKTKFYKTKYGTKVAVKKFVVDCFIIDKNGIFIAEDGNDGYNKINTYHNLTLDKHGDCKIFFNSTNALNYVKSICI